MSSSEEINKYIHYKMGPTAEKAEVINGEIRIQIEADMIADTLNFLKTDHACSFEQLMGITAADYPSDPKRFEVVYLLLSLKNNIRAIVKIRTDEATPVPSVTDVYASANWYEREVWDMFGVKFSDHPDLRRILTDYGFEGHPLRKDFPLTGFYEVRYDEEQKQVVYENVNLNQEFRVFDFTSPWEGAKYPIPNELKGDEKAGTK